MQIPELASNITMRLFLRPFEAVLSFKSLFKGVPDHRLSSNFTCLALFTPRFSWACYWGQNWEKKLRSLEANGGCLRPFEAKVKLWVSKFIFFHADSGNGLKQNFEAENRYRNCFGRTLENIYSLLNQKFCLYWYLLEISPTQIPKMFEADHQGWQ